MIATRARSTRSGVAMLKFLVASLVLSIPLLFNTPVFADTIEPVPDPRFLQVCLFRHAAGL